MDARPAAAAGAGVRSAACGEQAGSARPAAAAGNDQSHRISLPRRRMRRPIPRPLPRSAHRPFRARCRAGGRRAASPRSASRARSRSGVAAPNGPKPALARQRQRRAALGRPRPAAPRSRIVLVDPRLAQRLAHAPRAIAAAQQAAALGPGIGGVVDIAELRRSAPTSAAQVRLALARPSRARAACAEIALELGARWWRSARHRPAPAPPAAPRRAAWAARGVPSVALRLPVDRWPSPYSCHSRCQMGKVCRREPFGDSVPPRQFGVSADKSAYDRDRHCQTMTELVPTPNDCPLPRRRADFATFTEAVDYAARSAKGLNFHDARGQLERVYPYCRAARRRARDGATG